MPLISGMKSTSIWKAFILNAMASTLIIFIAVTVKEYFDTYKDKKDQEIVRTTTFKSISFTIAATFIATLIAYTTMYLIFGYGGGLLVNSCEN
jgi:ABC-type spermidine/putrescine transport system permease subunit I